MRENCTYGSEGGEAKYLPDPYPGPEFLPCYRLALAGASAKLCHCQKVRKAKEG